MRTIFAGAMLSLCGFTLGGAGASNLESSPERVTFYKDVLPILQENCQACHRPNGANLGGMVAPMAFTSYQDTRPWAKSIVQKTRSREMPPWDAAPEQHGVFANERTLTDGEIETLVKWVDTGAAKGNPADGPEPIEWPASHGWTIGDPDLVIEMPKRHFVADEVEDQYEYFTHRLTEEQLPEDRWIKAVEFRSGSPVVHHIILDPLGGIAPGSDALVYPEGMGRVLEKGARLTWQMHYHKEPGPGTGVWDQSSVAVKFYENADEVKHPVLGSYLGNMGFRIPAGDPNYSVQSKHTFRKSSKIVAFSPHMHLRGKSAKYEVQYPDGRHEVLLEVPQYDFNWQTTYWFKEPKLMPKGTQLTFTSVWDNSADNPYNPDPTREVTYGEPTTDEMSFGFMDYIAAEGAGE